MMQTLVLDFVKNAQIRGITLLNSKFFHMNIFSCENVVVDKVTITAPGDSPNTDGIHVGDSTNVAISGATIGTGDDCISIGPGSRAIRVQGVKCGPGHGISVGSLGRYPGEEDVRRLRVANCTIAGTANGVRIKTWRGGSRPTAVAGLVFEDIVMVKVRNPIIIDQEYCPYASCRRESVRAKLTDQFLAGRDDLSRDAQGWFRPPACRSSGRRR